MTSMERDKVLRKIKDLFRLAHNAGATPAEAATALEKAQALLIRYALTQQDVDNAGEPADKKYVVHEFEFCTAAIQLTIRELILAVSARAAMCEYVLLYKRARVPARVALVGTEAATQVARYMFEYLTAELTRMATQSMPADYRGKNIEYKQRRWKINFVMAATWEIGERLKKPLEAARTDASTRALMVVSDEQLKQAMATFFPKITVKKWAKLTSVQSAQALGAKAGKEIPLNMGIGAGDSAANEPVLIA